MILIAAVAANGVIGRDDRLPWDIPEEYRHFLDTISGATVLMGSRSWRIFGADLTSRHNVVLSRSAGTDPGAIFVNGLTPALERARELGGTLYVAGGASIYAATLPLADRMVLSHLKQAYEGDALFPKFDPTAWRVANRVDRGPFEIVDYERDRSEIRDAQ